MSVDYGLKISQPGFDVESATDKQLILSSKLNALKNYIVGTANVNIPANTVADTLLSVTVNHNLGYVPAVVAYANDGSQAILFNSVAADLGSTLAPESAVTDNIYVDMEIDINTVKFYCLTYDVGGSSPFWGAGAHAVTITFKYYIFSQQIN